MKNNHPWVNQAIRHVEKVARKRGIAGGLRTWLQQILAATEAMRGFKHSVFAPPHPAWASALLRLEVETGRTKQSRLAPLTLTAKVEEGEVSLPDTFDQGYEFSQKGINAYCQEKTASANPPPPFKIWDGSWYKIAGIYVNADEVKDALRRKGFLVTTQTQGNTTFHEIVTAPDKIRLAQNTLKVTGRPWTKEAAKCQMQGCDKDTESEKTYCKEHGEKLHTIKQAAAPAESASDAADVLENDSDRQITAYRKAVRNWLEEGGGDWYDLIEEFSARWEDPTFAPLRMQTIIWTLADTGDEVYALDPQGEPFRVRTGCDITGSEKIWIERKSIKREKKAEGLGWDDHDEYDWGEVESPYHAWITYDGGMGEEKEFASRSEAEAWADKKSEELLRDNFAGAKIFVSEASDAEQDQRPYWVSPDLREEASWQQQDNSLFPEWENEIIEDEGYRRGRGGFKLSRNEK